MGGGGEGQSQGLRKSTAVDFGGSLEGDRHIPGHNPGWEQQIHFALGPGQWVRREGGRSWVAPCNRGGQRRAEPPEGGGAE